MLCILNVTSPSLKSSWMIFCNISSQPDTMENQSSMTLREECRPLNTINLETFHKVSENELLQSGSSSRAFTSFFNASHTNKLSSTRVFDQNPTQLTQLTSFNDSSCGQGCRAVFISRILKLSGKEPRFNWMAISIKPFSRSIQTPVEKCSQPACRHPRLTPFHFNMTVSIYS